jgi:hypothetical protein
MNEKEVKSCLKMISKDRKTDNKESDRTGPGASKEATKDEEQPTRKKRGKKRKYIICETSSVTNN